MALDATLTWQNNPGNSAPGINETGFVVNWTLNGAPAASVSVPATAAGNTSGYSLDFATSNPTVTVKDGDVIGATIDAVDAADNLASPFVPSVPATVQEPIPPPPPVAPLAPVNVVLALS